MLAALNHPNIAGIHDLVEAEGRGFLVMEVAEGEELAAIIDNGPLLVEETVRIALSLAEALEAAHEKGIIHRDLKPGNVKFDESGGVKILDFGLAKALAGDSSSAIEDHRALFAQRRFQAAAIDRRCARRAPRLRG